MNLKKAAVHTAVLVCMASTVCLAADMDWKYDADKKSISISGYGMINDGSPLVQYLDSAEKIEMQKGVTKIEKNVFSNCGIVEEVVLPEGFVSIGNDAFSFSKKLKKINFPESMESIGDEAFMGCPELENVIIPKNVSYMGPNAFADCTAIESFEVADDNPYFTTVDGVIFSKDKTELVIYPAGRKDETYTIPDGTLKIRSKAFAYNAEIKSIETPESLEEIDDYAFYFCEKLKNANLGSGVKSIGDYAFYGSGLKNIYVPYGCEKIGTGALKNCELLAVADIPGTAVRLGKDIFYGTDEGLKIRGKNLEAYASESKRSFEPTVRIKVSGKELRTDVPVFIRNDCTMVPMRSIFEALNADVGWDGDTRTAYAKRDGIECSFKIDENILYKDGKPIELITPAIVENNRTFVPVRAIAEAFGENVEWDSETGLVTIN